MVVDLYIGPSVRSIELVATILLLLLPLSRSSKGATRVHIFPPIVHRKFASSFRVRFKESN